MIPKQTSGSPVTMEKMEDKMDKYLELKVDGGMVVVPSGEYRLAFDSRGVPRLERMYYHSEDGCLSEVWSEVESKNDALGTVNKSKEAKP